MRKLGEILPYAMTLILIVLGLSIAVGHNLDKPIPVRQNGEIVAFETPDGRVESDDPRFGNLVRSYSD